MTRNHQIKTIPLFFNLFFSLRNYVVNRGTDIIKPNNQANHYFGPDYPLTIELPFLSDRPYGITLLPQAKAWGY